MPLLFLNQKSTIPDCLWFHTDMLPWQILPIWTEHSEIDNEIKSKDGHIKIKVNSICDLGIMNKLNEAADTGVKIDILCRGICSIIPRKNIKAYSIIGKHLEHSRIYSFKNGGKWKDFKFNK